MSPMPQGQPHRLGVLKAASNAFLAGERTFDGPEDPTV
jgi:hypothetical protein